VDMMEFLRVYERFADRPLSLLQNPGPTVAGIYAPSNRGHAMLRRFKGSDQWMAVVSILAVAAIHLGAEVEFHKNTHIRVHLGMGLIEATEAGCWSMNRQAFHPAHGAPDCLWLPSTIPSVKTHNAHIAAIVDLGGKLEPDTQLAAATVALGLQEELITPADLRSELRGALDANL
jgi:hypothetical protein